MREIHWAVLGTGVIANEMATALEKNAPLKKSNKQADKFPTAKSIFCLLHGR